MSELFGDRSEGYVRVENASGASRIVIVCEHASPHIPDSLDGLGLSPEARLSHAAWDPGALAVAQALAKALDAPLIASTISRLVYDCNRPPSAPDAMPARVERITVPGNADVTLQDRAARIDAVYEPFHARVAEVLSRTTGPVLITVHSFTPVYDGTRRTVEIGILHDADTRLGDAMLKVAPAHTTADVRRNEPYGPRDGVTHTLVRHTAGTGHLNVMLEIRSDLIETPAQQDETAAMLSPWIAQAIATAQSVPCPG